MPGGDRTGPVGMGPRTGRAAGYCAGNDVPGFANPAGRWGGGLGRGRGRGMAFRRGGNWGAGWGRGGRWWGFQQASVPWAPKTAAKPNAIQVNEQIEQLQEELTRLRERIEELKVLLPKGEQKS